MLFWLNFLFCPGFLTFWDKSHAISGPGQIKFKSPDFPHFQVPLGTLLKVGTPVCMYKISG